MNPKVPLSFKDYLLSSPRAWSGVLLWLLATALVVLALVSLHRTQAERLFGEQARHAANAVYEKVHINEAVLEGFASLVRLLGAKQSDQIRKFTSEMRAAYPHIYMLEVQTYVSDGQRSAFELEQRRQGYRDYRIKEYDYGDRSWRDLAAQPGYYPIHFVEPMGTNADAVLGLDVLSVPFLRDGLVSATRTGQATATVPFTLVEGGRAYVLFKALAPNPDFAASAADVGVKGSTVVSLLVKTRELLRYASESIAEAEVEVDLFYRDHTGETVTDTYHGEGNTHFVLVLGQMSYRRELDDTGQPFVLEFRKASGLTSWELASLALLVTGLLVLAWFFFQGGYRRYLSDFELDRERQGLERRIRERTEALSQKNEAIRRLAGQVVNLQEEDYRHIARELHDEFGQCITAIAINTKLVADRLPEDPDARALSLETQSLVDQLLNALHSLVSRLRPESLDMFGLSAAIRHCVALFKFEQLGIQCQLTLDPAIDVLSDNHAITVYRVVQELLNNAVKHAEATSVRISVRKEGSRVQIEVIDDGRGMTADRQASGYGLKGLVERLATFEGQLRISSPAGGGCRAEAVLPLVSGA